MLTQGSEAIVEGLTALSEWLEQKRTPEELASARTDLKKWEDAVSRLSEDVRSRLIEMVRRVAPDKYLSALNGGGNAILPLSAGHEAARVQVSVQRPKQPNERLVRERCKLRGVIFEDEAALPEKVWTPSITKMKHLVTTGKWTQEDFDACFPIREVVTVR